MSGVTIGKQGRVYERKFDHDEARARYAAGESGRALAAEYDVSPNAVYRVVNDDFRERQARTAAQWQRSGKCPDCGVQTTRRPTDSCRCKVCSAVEQATTVRDGALHCSVCGEWKPDDAFPADPRRIARRGRRRDCRACNTRLRREYRKRNRERERAYDRAYRARKRVSA